MLLKGGGTRLSVPPSLPSPHPSDKKGEMCDSHDQTSIPKGRKKKIKERPSCDTTAVCFERNHEGSFKSAVYFQAPPQRLFYFYFLKRKKKESKEEEEALLPACVFYLMVLAGGVMGKQEGSDRKASSLSVFKPSEGRKKTEAHHIHTPGQQILLNDSRMYLKSLSVFIPFQNCIRFMFRFTAFEFYCWLSLFFFLFVISGLRGQSDQ